MTVLNSSATQIRRLKWLLAAILVGSLVGYPLMGTMVAFTQFPSLLASVPVRLFVVLCSAVLIFRGRHLRTNALLAALYVFWAIYALRLIADFWNPDIPGTDLEIVYFVATCVIPTLAVTRAPRSQWDEALIARWLTAVGAATCAFALLPFASGLELERSLWEVTGRLSFDTVNPITYGHVAVTTIISGVAVLRQTTRPAAKLAWIACMMIAAVALQMAGSRGPMLALTVCAVAWVLTHRGRKRLALPALAVCVVVALAILSNGESDVWQRLLNVEDDPSTLERISLQTNAIRQFVDNPFLGSAHVELESLTYPHNPLIEAGMATGLTGILIFSTLSILMAARACILLRRGHMLIPLLALQYLFGAQFSGNLHQSDAMWILMAMTFARGTPALVRVSAAHPDALLPRVPDRRIEFQRAAHLPD